MALIDSNNFITHLVYSGLIDKATCGELKEAIELCTVKDTFSKADLAAMLTDIQLDIEELKTDYDKNLTSEHGIYYAYDKSSRIVQNYINALKTESEEV